MLLPFVYAIMQSLKPMEEIYAFPPRFFVVNPTLESYQLLGTLTDSVWVPFSRYLMNTVVVTVVSPFTVVVTAVLPAGLFCNGFSRNKNFAAKKLPVIKITAAQTHPKSLRKAVFLRRRK